MEKFGLELESSKSRLIEFGDLQSRIVEQEENVSLKHLVSGLPSTVAKREREVSCQRYRLQERSLS